MTRIESRKVEVDKPAAVLFDQLRDFRNFDKMMPDSVQQFEADEDSFMFQMKGLPEVRVQVDEVHKPHLIRLKSASSKLDFTLAAHIREISENTAEAYFEFSGNFNMMMRMMVEKPLKNFLENLAGKLREI